MLIVAQCSATPQQVVAGKDAKGKLEARKAAIAAFEASATKMCAVKFADDEEESE